MRYFSQIEMLSQEERAFFQSEAQKLGFRSLSSFAKYAMLEKISKGDVLYNAFIEILQILSKNETWLQEVEEPSADEAEGLKIIRIAEQIIIRSKVIKDSSNSYVDNIDEESGKTVTEFRYALVDNEKIDELLKIEI